MQKRLAMVRFVHNLVYVVMTVSVFAMLYAGITGARGWWLTLALVFALGEAAVYVVNGMSCPLTQIARRNGAGPDEGYALDTWISPRAAGIMFKSLTAVGLVGLVLIAVRSL
jgi:hypothetical protein